MIEQTLQNINMAKAVQYCFDNPRISLHEIANIHGLKNAAQLQHEYRKEWYKRKCNESEGNCTTSV